jgi:SAM-dependent methyltransferase
MDRSFASPLALPTGPYWQQCGGMDTMTPPGYVHGYSAREARRLGDQADALAELLHVGTAYPAGSRVLEIGCGVGAQTVHLLARSPNMRLVCVDRSTSSLAQARARVAESAPAADVEWHEADLFDLPFPDASFDHLFVCFVLEHLADPHKALVALRRVLRPGGTITVIEGDFGSTFFHPASIFASAVADCLVQLQADAGGNALLGRELHPLLTGAGYAGVSVAPRTVYVDGTRPALVTGFIRDTFTAIVEGVRDQALLTGLMTEAAWDQGIADLRRTAEPGGAFHFVFFKGTAVAPQ